MRRFIRSAFALLLAAGASCIAAQGAEGEALQRERIGRERDEAEAAYAAREAVCRERFVVTACIDRARAERRDRLDELRRQAEVLDGQERRRRAAARLESILEKTESLERPRTPRSAEASAPPRRGTGPASASTTSTDLAAPSPALPREAEATRRASEAAAARRANRSEAVARRAAVGRAAAERAAAAEQRRREAAEAERGRSEAPARSKPSAPLPPRPVLPSASMSMP